MMNEINDHTLQQISTMLKALAEPTRLKMMQQLHQGECSVGDLVSKLDCTQANVSRHLKNLSSVNLVKSRKDGTTVFYSISDPCVDKMCESICGGFMELYQKREQLMNL